MIGANPLWLARRAGFSPQFVPLDAAASVYPTGFSRSGPVIVPDASGVMQTFATDAPAREYIPGYGWGYWTHPSYVVGLTGAATHDLTSANWTPTGLTVVSDVTSPEPTGTSTVVRETAAFGTHRIRAFCSSATVIGSIFRLSVIFGSKTNQATRIETAWGNALFTYPGTLVVESGTMTTSVTALGSGWVRVDLLVTATSAATFPYFYLHSVPPGGIIGDITKGFHVYAVNASVDSLLGAPIVKVPVLTTSVVVGEARWRGTLSSIGVSTVGALGLSGYLRNAAAPPSSSHILRVDNNSESARVLLYRPAGDPRILLLATGAGGTHAEAGPTTPAAFKTGAIVNADAGARAAVNGVLMTVTTGSTDAPTGLTHWSVGSGVGAGLASAMLVNRVWLHPTVISTADLTKETT